MFYHFLDKVMRCLVIKMAENAECNGDKCFLKPKMTSSNVLFCLQTRDIQFTVKEE